MIKKIKLDGLLLALSFLLLFPYYGVTQENTDIYEKIDKNMDIFGRMYKEILLNYVDNIDADKFFEAGIEGMLKTLDPYTVYYNEKNQDAVDLITTGKYGGIGITISVKDSIVYITDVMNGYEASRKGLRTGDIIKEIDSQPVAGMKIEDIRKLVRGKAGTPISLKVERNATIIDFELIRQEIILKNISYYGFISDSAKGIAYIRLDRFTQNSGKEFENALRTMNSARPINALIIDLRNNGGGLLEEAIDILNKLTEKNSPLLTTRGSKKDSEKKYFSKDEPLINTDIPVSVLINGGSASASEIVAGAIQDLDRGIIIGSKSFGKGLVQQIKNLEYGTKLKITTFRYFTPSGRWIQSKNYFEDNKYGVFLNTEKFKQKEFKTLGGRKVYASGGITPDIEINLAPESSIHFALLASDLFFKYANYYLSMNSGIKVFKPSDKIFTDFIDFIKTQGFDYKSESEKRLNELRKTAEGKQYSDRFNKMLDEMEREIDKSEESEYIAAKDEIFISIEAEINKRLITDKEQIEATFDTDKQLQEAIKVVTDIDYYNQILKK